MSRPNEGKDETEGLRDRESLGLYRESLVLAEEKAQSEYDRLIVALSGGALGVSFAFVNQFIGDRKAQWVFALVGAWFCWVVSPAFILGEA